MTRQLFITGMQAKLKDFDEKLARLAARPKPKSEHALLEREKTYHFLKASRAELYELLRRSEYSPDESWGEFKESMQRVYDDMARRVDED